MLVIEIGGIDFDLEQLSVGQDVSDKVNEFLKIEGMDRGEERGLGMICEQDIDFLVLKGLVKCYMLLIEGRLYLFD